MGLVATLIINALWALGAFVLFYGTGHLLWHLVRGEDRCLSQDLVISTSLGVAVVSYLLFGLSWLGAYRSAPISALLAVLLLASLYPFIRLMLLVWGGIRTNSLQREDYWTAIPPALLIAVEFVRSCLPNTENDAYHYELPLIWLRHGTMHDTGATLYDGFTHAVHLVYGAGLAVGGDAAANKVAWIAFLVCLVGAVAMSRAAGWPRRVGLYAACALGAIHSLAAEASGGLIDIHVLMFAIAAGVVGFRWLRGKDPLNILLFGGLLGMLGGTKQNGWLAAACLLFAFTAADIVNRGIRRGLYALAWATPAFLVIGGPWLYWSYQVTGNPVYPAFNSLFGAVGHGLGWGEEATRRGFDRNLLTYLTYPWRLNLDFSLLRESWAYGIGPAMIAFAPLAVFYRQRGLAVVASALFLGAFLSAMYVFAPHMVRYLYPAFAFSALLAGNAAYTIHSHVGRCGRSTITLLFIGPVLLATAMEVGRLAPRDAREFMLGRISASQYRDRHHNYVGHALITEANVILPMDAKVLVVSVKGLGLEREYVAANRFATVVLRDRPLSTAAVLEAARSEGLTHVIAQMSPRALALTALAQKPVEEWRDRQIAVTAPPGYDSTEIERAIRDALHDPLAAKSAYEAMFFPRQDAAVLLALSEHLTLLYASPEVEHGYIYELRMRGPGGDAR